MLQLKEGARFRKDLKRVRKRGKDIEKLKAIVRLLSEEKPLPLRNKDHVLVGDYEGFRECHIEPDWLLIYRIEEDNLILVRIGTHSDLFE